MVIIFGLGGPKSWAAGPSEFGCCLDNGAAALAVPAVGTAAAAGVLRLKPDGC